jgi:hypothetical protein
MAKDQGGKTEFSALVPTPEYEKFRRRFPGYGASTWFINSALLEFNARMEQHPELQKEIEKSIEAMWGLNRMTASGS